MVLSPLRSLVFFLMLCTTTAWSADPVAKHVIAISIDGLRPDAITTLGPERAPALHRMMREGTSTLNARTDHDHTVTIPNHTCMLTGRPVKGSDGHGYTRNYTPLENLHAVHDGYVDGVFCVVHDREGSTALFASKIKFYLFPMTWGDGVGARDRVPPDHGTSKIDVIGITTEDRHTEMLVLDTLKQSPPAFTFLHFRDGDSTGHKKGWMSPDYLDAIANIDTRLGHLLDLISNDAELSGRTTVLLTADHGGTGKGHSDATKPEQYTIPFLAWGAGVAPGADLYVLNPTRADPGQDRIPYDAAKPPIRNGDIANLSLSLLGMAAVPGLDHRRRPGSAIETLTSYDRQTHHSAQAVREGPSGEMCLASFTITSTVFKCRVRPIYLQS